MTTVKYMHQPNWVEKVKMQRDSKEALLIIWKVTMSALTEVDDCKWKKHGIFWPIFTVDKKLCCLHHQVK